MPHPLNTLLYSIRRVVEIAMGIALEQRRVHIAVWEVRRQHCSKHHPWSPQRECLKPCTAREMGCSVPVWLAAYVVVVLVTVLLAGDVESNPGPSYVICGTWLTSVVADPVSCIVHSVIITCGLHVLLIAVSACSWIQYSESDWSASHAY